MPYQPTYLFFVEGYWRRLIFFPLYSFPGHHNHLIGGIVFILSNNFSAFSSYGWIHSLQKEKMGEGTEVYLHWDGIPLLNLGIYLQNSFVAELIDEVNSCSNFSGR